uniref:Poly(A) specific ribonuclease subunit PAN3 n=1 Tax=Ciona savignyi TaxID=51511 RepID=H2ZDN7_CIOSA
MAGYATTDAAMFDQINSALVGELPSFGIAKESKFQHLMQRNVQQPDNMMTGGENKFDTSLSVDATAFQPTPEPSWNNPPPPGIPNVPLPQPSLGQPNPAAREFVPRNMSAPNLTHAQQNGGFPEFIPNRSGRALNGMQQQTPFVSQQSNPFLPSVPGAHGDIGPQMVTQHTMNTSTSMLEYLPGTHMPSPVPTHDPRLSVSSSVFTSPQSQNNSSTYYTGDSNTPLTASSMGGFSTP